MEWDTPDIPAVPEPVSPVPHPSAAIQPYNISNYTIGALYLLLIGWSLWNLRTHFESRLLIDAPKLLFAHVVAWGIVRAVFAFFTDKMWNYVWKRPVLQVFLDLLPEILYLCIFSLLIAMWTNVFARSKYLRLRKPENILWATHGILSGLIFLSAMIVLIVVAAGHNNGRTYLNNFRYWETYWMIASAVIVMVGTGLFGVAVALSLSKMELISDFLKKQARKVRLLVFITFLGITLKTIYNLLIGRVVNAWVNKDPEHRAQAKAVIFFFYLFLTDVVPVAIILTAFITPGKKKKTNSGREYVHYAEEDVESSDGLLSNEENY